MKDINLFVSSLKNLCQKHGISLIGRMRIVNNEDDWDVGSFDISHKEVVDYGYAKDTSGPFLESSIHKKEAVSHFRAQRVNTVIMDKDYLLRDGIASPINGKGFTNRREWNDHLKENDCVEVGNDLNKATGKKPLEGDFDCRRELTQAVEKVLG